MLDQEIKKDFPLLTSHPELVFADNAATTQKPAVAIEAEKALYETTYANIHRATYDIASSATQAFEDVREQIRVFINARQLSEIIFTKNASEALNLAAYVIGQQVRVGDELLVSVTGHHSNILPWIRLAKEKKLGLKWIEITPEGRLDMDSFRHGLSPKTKVVVLEHVSNVLGCVHPLQEITTLAHEVGALVVADAAQSSCRMPINVQELDVDFMSFSSHKMYGPTGLGFLYAKQELVAEAEPLIAGGGTIKEVHRDRIVWADSPWRFEAGTPPIAEVVGFGATLTYLTDVGMDQVWAHDQEITAYAMEQFLQLPFFTLFGSRDTVNRAAIFSFLLSANDKPIHSHDVADIANKYHVAIRGGHHCAQVLMQTLGVHDVNRASFGMYNSKQDVDDVVAALTAAQKTFL